MKPFIFGLRDWWGQWAVDRAGVEFGAHRVSRLREMLDRGEIRANSWLRHRWTRKFALVGDVLFLNDLASVDEYEAWFPKPKRMASRAA